MSATSARNAATVKAFYQAEIDRDLDTWTGFWRKDGRLSFWLNEMKDTIHGRDRLVELEAEKFVKLAEATFTMDVTADPLEDETKVLARLKLHPAGISAAFHYWLLFHFDEDGLIVELEEIADTTLPAGISL